jgi:hypothetical protein
MFLPTRFMCARVGSGNCIAIPSIVIGYSPGSGVKRLRKISGSPWYCRLSPNGVSKVPSSSIIQIASNGASGLFDAAPEEVEDKAWGGESVPVSPVSPVVVVALVVLASPISANMRKPIAAIRRANRGVTLHGPFGAARQWTRLGCGSHADVSRPRNRIVRLAG